MFQTAQDSVQHKLSRQSQKKSKSERSRNNDGVFSKKKWWQFVNEPLLNFDGSQM